MLRYSNQIVFRCSSWSNESVPCSVALLGYMVGLVALLAQRWKELEIGRKATPKVSEGMSCTVEHGSEVVPHLMTSMSSCFQHDSEKSQIVGLHTHTKIN